MWRLFKIQMSKGGSVTDRTNEFNMIINQLSSKKIIFTDKIEVLILMPSLPKSCVTAVP